MSKLWLPALLLAACAPAPAASTTPVDNQPTPTAAGERVPCPAEPELYELAGHAFERAGTSGIVCTALWAGEPFWLLDGWIEQPFDESTESGGVTLALALVTPGGEVAWVQRDDGYPPSVIDRKTGGEWTAVDLDGDGEDELLVTDGWNTHGYETVALLAYDVVDRALVASPGSLPLVDDNSAAIYDDGDVPETCTAEHRIVDGPGGEKHVVITADPAATRSGPECPAPGVHTYRWDGKALVEI